MGIKKNNLWKKGEIAKSQSEVYSKLQKDTVVIFYQERDSSSPRFKIEMATDALSFSYFIKNYDEIMRQVKNNSNGRQICCFNL